MDELFSVGSHTYQSRTAAWASYFTLTQSTVLLAWSSQVKGQEVISAEVTDYVNQHGPNIKVTTETPMPSFGVGSCVP